MPAKLKTARIDYRQNSSSPILPVVKTQQCHQIGMQAAQSKLPPPYRYQVYSKQQPHARMQPNN
ncbi:hypothetical protein [Snodgrassella communis]|uniref:hypothetical protein n=1 Tax=Snodgrassella communis TaxID=2946699 RepID=UPI001EF4427D|nr:hypothetical protein [Snodgrassella communis]WMY92371.1 hypothetical protein PYG29_03140 [Snodgrassella communis]